MHGMPSVTGDAGRRAADIITAARERQVPVMTIREAARRTGISVEGWNKALKKGSGRQETFIAMARVVGVEAGVRDALGLTPVSADQPQVVRDHARDENVRALWNLRVSEDQRLSLIEAYLAGRPGAGELGSAGSG